MAPLSGRQKGFPLRDPPFLPFLPRAGEEGAGGPGDGDPWEESAARKRRRLGQMVGTVVTGGTWPF